MKQKQKLVKWYDIDECEIVSTAQLKREWKALFPDWTFEEYLADCMVENGGTIEPYTGINQPILDPRQFNNTREQWEPLVYLN